ncbi:hypothetical protein Golax_025827 [Gossypium laxum]|uniref:Uncharacterized protein n=1 Tax=Gossypium laxum TaxID=34288 RepID=A0A7J9AZW1_9ROSI|nr:hypothetical protein [Gossypium laxum]
MKFNDLSKKVRVQCSYTGGTQLLPTSFITCMEKNNKARRTQRISQQTGVEEAIEKQSKTKIMNS